MLFRLMAAFGLALFLTNGHVLAQVQHLADVKSQIASTHPRERLAVQMADLLASSPHFGQTERR